jgi:hypothetical protein
VIHHCQNSLQSTCNIPAVYILFHFDFWNLSFPFIIQSTIANPDRNVKNSVHSCVHTLKHIWGGLRSLWFYKENNKLQDWKNVFISYIPPWTPHTYDFVVLTSLTRPRKILLVVLKIGKQEIAKAKDLLAHLRMEFSSKRHLRARGLSDCVEESWRDWNHPRKHSRLAWAVWTRPWISVSDRGTPCCGHIFLFISISTTHIIKSSIYLFPDFFPVF